MDGDESLTAEQAFIGLVQSIVSALLLLVRTTSAQ